MDRSHFISLWLWFTCLLSFVLLGPLYVIAGLFISPRRLHPVGRWICGALLRCAGQRVTLRGPFPPVDAGPYIYVFNHTSLLDTFIVIASLPEFTTAVGKKEQFRIPIWGSIIRRWGAVPIDRSELQNAIRSLDEVSRVVASGMSLLVAPEGTRSADGTLGPFKKGPFHIAHQQKTPIVPLYITGAYQSKNRGSWVLRPGTIEVRVLAPLYVDSAPLPTVDELRDTTRERFIQAIDGE